MITLKNGTFSIGAENSYQGWLCRFRDAAKKEMTQLEIYMFYGKIIDAGFESNLSPERIKANAIK